MVKEESGFLPSSMFVYPGPRLSVQGRGEHVFVKQDGTKVPAGRTFHKNATKDYCFPLESNGLRLDTGLDEFIDNPFKIKDFADKWIRDYWTTEERLRTDDTITKQTYLEVMHNRPKGTYTSEKKVTKPFDKDATESTFLESFRVSLKDGPNVYTIGNPDDEISMILIKRHPKFSPTKDAFNGSQHEFYIGKENEARAETQLKRDKKRKALVALDSLIDDYTDFEMYQIAIVMQLALGDMSKAGVREKIEDFVWKEDNKSPERWDQFLNTFKYLDSTEGLERLYTRYVFQQAINNRIISVLNGSFIWHSKKGVQNLYNLGTKEKVVLNMFHSEMQNNDEDGFYHDLLRELKTKNVRLEP